MYANSNLGRKLTTIALTTRIEAMHFRGEQTTNTSSTFKSHIRLDTLLHISLRWLFTEPTSLSPSAVLAQLISSAEVKPFRVGQYLRSMQLRVKGKRRKIKFRSWIAALARVHCVTVFDFDFYRRYLAINANCFWFCCTWIGVGEVRARATDN